MEKLTVYFSLGAVNSLWAEERKVCIFQILLLLSGLCGFSEWADNGEQKLEKRTPSNFFPIANGHCSDQTFRLFLLYLAQGKFKQYVWYLKVFKDQHNDSNLIIRSLHKLFLDLYKCVSASTTHQTNKHININK